MGGVVYFRQLGDKLCNGRGEGTDFSRGRDQSDRPKYTFGTSTGRYILIHRVAYILSIEGNRLGLVNGELYLQTE